LRGKKKETPKARELEVKKKIRRFLRFPGRKKEEIVEEKKPELEEAGREFPEISAAEQKKHVGKHVAIAGGKIVASAGTARKALTMAKRKHSGEKIDIRYIGGERLLLRCKCLGD